MTFSMKTNPNILFIIERSVNKNIVVYEGIIKNGQFVDNNPCIVYWMDIDPEFVAKARKKGKTSDRVELNILEKNMAYGLRSVPNGDGTYQITLMAFPDRIITLRVSEEGTPVAIVDINGTRARLNKIYVKCTYKMFGLPNVKYIYLEGTDLKTKTFVKERIDR